MLLIIHNLPKEVTPFDVRQLIQEQCGLREVILDNLLDEGPGKRITVGLAEEEEAAMLLRKLNGLHYKKCQLYVEDVRKKKLSAPTYPVLIPSGLQPQVPRPWLIANVPKTAPTLQVNKSSMPYYMTQDTSNIFGKQPQTTQQDTSFLNQYYKYKPNEMLQTNNLIDYPVTLNPNAQNVPNTPPSFKTYQIGRDKESDARDNTKQLNWRENKSPPSKRSKNFGNFSQRESRFGDKTSEWNKNTEVSRRSRDGDKTSERNKNIEVSRRSRDGDKTSEWNKNTEVPRRSRDVDRSPPRARDFFRKKQKDDIRDDFYNSRRSRSTRSNPRDKDAYSRDYDVLYPRDNDREQNSPFSRQKDRVSDQHERRNVQKRNYEQDERIARENVERPKKSSGNVFETSTTFSSKPEHTFFTKPNKSTFDKIKESRGFEDTSNNIVQFPSPKQDTFKSQDNFPAQKRARFDPPQYFGNKKFVNPNAPSNNTTDLHKMWTRHTNWRIQSATLLAKEVLKNASTSRIENNIFKDVLKKLRECIMSRIDVILGDKIATNLEELLRGYRTKFNNQDDINFFKAVMEKVQRENEENADGDTGPNLGKEKPQHQDLGKLYKGPSVVNPFYSPRPNVTQLKQQQQYSGKFNKGPNVVNPFYSPRSQLMMKPYYGPAVKQKGTEGKFSQNLPFIKDPKTMPKLPKYPNSDKQGYKESQRYALLELEEGYYVMEPDFERAVNEEVEKLFECYIEGCKPPEPSTNEDEDQIRNKIITSTADEFKKIIKLDVTKRILNVTDRLTLRIFSTPKPAPKAALDEYLKKHGVINLKKSDTKNMFLANCDSYESYDRLLAMKTINFGQVTVEFKPFQVLGPLTKKKIKVNQATADSSGEDFTKDVDGLEIDLRDGITDDVDVMLIENENSEVVVIRDDLDNSFSSGNTSVIADVNNDKVKEMNDLKVLHSNDKVSDSNEKICNSNDKVSESNEKICNSNDKVDDSNEKLCNLNEKVDDSNEKICNSDDKVDNSNEKVCNSNEKVDDSNEKICKSNDKVDDSDNKVNAFKEINEDSIDKVPNSQSEDLNKSDTKVLESLNDIFNEAGEILEDDLEDF